MSYGYYVSFKGAKQGQFKGESKNPKRKDKWVEVLGFNEVILSPRDASGGQASGKRQHSPITITKEWGSASPQLFEACLSQEMLPEVVIETVEELAIGMGEKVVRRITLSNAQIRERRPHVGPASIGGRMLTEFDIVFQKIESTSDASKTKQDSWTA